MPTVRTTMQPDVDLDVSDTEYVDLTRQGLLVQKDEPAAETERAPAPAAAPAKTPAAKSSKEN
ncbi:hypothetical protein [Streptomyces sp. NPDC050416]|uniref:hypothetical protein n=1 Tax=Streptomyces sp. NPDC050416 TaxID=3365611 RepID=UPI003796E428